MSVKRTTPKSGATQLGTTVSLDYIPAEFDPPAGSMLADLRFVGLADETDDETRWAVTAAGDYEAITAARETLDQRYVPLGPIPSRLATNR